MKEYFIEYMKFNDSYLYRNIVKTDKSPKELIEDKKSHEISQITIRLNNFVVGFWKSI
jgi:uncharacterized HAD superfamily protein